jgi:hypothetical protein
MQDRCKVCAECTICLEIILDAHDGSISLFGDSVRVVVNVESHFSPFGDSVSVSAR